MGLLIYFERINIKLYIFIYIVLLYIIFNIKFKIYKLQTHVIYYELTYKLSVI